MNFFVPTVTDLAKMLAIVAVVFLAVTAGQVAGRMIGERLFGPRAWRSPPPGRSQTGDVSVVRC
ncbi:MAG TPA: hypothetical protein VFG88_10610 [Nocardioidaceae bacterium]|nr:hypothetical protein [Nocardioidaceae bacterium]